MNIQFANRLDKRSLLSCIQMAGLASMTSVVLLVSGCATQAPVKQVAEVQQVEWPAPPEQARIRYLGSLRALDDVDGKKKKSMRDIMMGEEEKENPNLQKPYGVHSDSKGRVFVADTVKGLVVFNIGEENISFWGVTGPGTLGKAVGVTSDAQGNVYVSDVELQRIVVFDTEGNYLNAFGGTEILGSPAGLVFNNVNQRLYVVDTKKNQIIVFDRQGNVDFTIGERGGEPGDFNFPTNIAVDANGRLYVSDTMNFRVQVFEMDGTVVNTFGQVGDRSGDFNRLKGVGVDSDGHIYTIDSSFDMLQIFDKDGKLLLFFGKAGNGPGEFYLPAGVHVDQNNKIFIADQYNLRIQMFEYLGGIASDETN